MGTQGNRHPTPASPRKALRGMLAEDSRETRLALSKAALRSARKVKSVPVRTAKELRDLTAVASQIGEWDKLCGEGKITLNVLNVVGDIVQGSAPLGKAFFCCPLAATGWNTPTTPTRGRAVAA
jgi:hypothetical protein